MLRSHDSGVFCNGEPLLRLDLYGDRPKNTPRGEKREMMNLFRRPLLIAGFIIAAVLCFIAAFGAVLCPNNPTATDMQNILAPPGGAYPLGTDDLGRCILSRLIAGTGATLGTALVIESIIFTFGMVVGMLAGYFDGAVDGAVVITIDSLLAFPSIILALVIAGILGAGLMNLVIAMCCVYWVSHARVARSITRSLSGQTFVLSARVAGNGYGKIILRHILPHVIPKMAVYFALDISSIIISVSSLSFIGLGVRPPAPEWGAMLNESRAYMTTNPLALILSIVCILIAVAGFQMIGEGIRDLYDTRETQLYSRKR